MFVSIYSGESLFLVDVEDCGKDKIQLGKCQNFWVLLIKVKVSPRYVEPKNLLFSVEHKLIKLGKNGKKNLGVLL